jgi:membrane protease YdiL (CAAX protease family)
MLFPSSSAEEFGIEKRIPKMHLLGYIGLFFSLWTTYVFFISPLVKMRYPDLYIYDVGKLLLWILPAFAYLKYEGLDILTYLKLRKVTQEHVKWAVLISLAFVANQLIGRMVAAHELKFSVFFAAHHWVKGVILVGFTEEILFRGFFLQKIAAYTKFGIANSITSVLFLLIHFPGWIALDALPAGNFFKLYLFAFIVSFSLIEGYVLKKTGSLWVCIVIHSINNFMSYALGA